jgi:DNA invertase Pin-like site-specific DNA recombinase
MVIPDRVVAYYRVSTDKQGKSGLGLEAQQAAVRAYLVLLCQQFDEVVDIIGFFKNG